MNLFPTRLFILLALIPATTLTAQAAQESTDTAYPLAPIAQTSQTESPLSQASLYHLQQAAEQGDSVAMEQLARHYLADTGTPSNSEQALRWLIKLATLGDTQAAIIIGKRYEQGEHFPNPLTMAEFWYHSVAERDTTAEEHYSRVLQKKFDQQRAKQISNITALENATHSPTLNEPLPNSSSSSSQVEPTQRSISWVQIGLFSLFALLFGVALFALYFRINSRGVHSSSQSLQLDQNKQQLNEQAVLIKQQKRQLDTLYRELKRLQQQQNSQQQEQQLALACSCLGVNPQQLPDERRIKLRYKQLSKIYHPDTQGSDEEMKRLNESLQIVLHASWDSSTKCDTPKN